MLRKAKFLENPMRLSVSCGIWLHTNRASCGLCTLSYKHSGWRSAGWHSPPLKGRGRGGVCNFKTPSLTHQALHTKPCPRCGPFVAYPLVAGLSLRASRCGPLVAGRQTPPLTPPLRGGEGSGWRDVRSWWLRDVRMVSTGWHSTGWHSTAWHSAGWYSTAWPQPDGTPHPSRGGVGAGSVTF